MSPQTGLLRLQGPLRCLDRARRGVGQVHYKSNLDQRRGNRSDNRRGLIGQFLKSQATHVPHKEGHMTCKLDEMYARQ
jgi:hypothetical protein